MSTTIIFEINRNKNYYHNYCTAVILKYLHVISFFWILDYWFYTVFLKIFCIIYYISMNLIYIVRFFCNLINIFFQIQDGQFLNFFYIMFTVQTIITNNLYSKKCYDFRKIIKNKALDLDQRFSKKVVQNKIQSKFKIFYVQY